MKRLAVIAACAFTISAHAQTIATVNGQKLTQQELDGFVSLLVSQGAQDSDELRQQVKEEMINRLIVVDAAKKAGIDKKSSVQQELELARQGILVRALMADQLEKNPVTDQDIQAEYEKLKKAQDDRLEYKARHILVEEEQEARDLLADIQSKKITFEQAAKDASIDPGSGKNGGELGWSPTSAYVPEFAQAVENLKKGELTTEPVQSQFGWHIIELQDSRPVPFPELDEVKTQIQEMLQQQRLAQFQQELIGSADVQSNDQ